MKSKYLILILTTLLFWSCEEDVVLDLGEIEKRLVVEAKVTNGSPMATVSLSYSQNFYDTPDYLLLENATVVLVSEDGETETLQMNSDHVYLSKTLQPKFGKKYTLKVSVDGQEFEVTTLLPPPVEITSANFVPALPFGPPSTRPTTESFNIFVNVADRVGEDNFFRLRVNKFGEEPTSEYYLVDDTFGKDGLISMPIYFKNFEIGDTVIVELYHLNEEIYQYYSGLSENLSGSFNSIAPGNPVSNMPDEVYGYFAGYSVDIDTIIVGALPF